MSRQLSRDLYHLMRKASRRTPVDKLRRNGHKNVSVLSFRDVQALIEQAVSNTLRRKGLKLDGPEIHEEVRMEFLALMRERDLLQETVQNLLREKDELAQNRERLQAVIGQVSDEIEEEQALDPGQDSDELDRMRESLVAALKDMLGPNADAQLTTRAVALVEQAVEEQRQLTLTRAQESHQARMEHLERRMNRLKTKLQETESMLQRAQAAGGPEGLAGEPIDPGLKIGDPNFETKKELLGEIFKLNVELREMLKTN
ncbi:MAG: hypothetical protein DHS20C15_32590 [Planctomycetota bacterium]|nr:MAG: hypothetical protein DHS20C15_32590 [Planctomycetota bacterium]